jgi:hypothetical protein
LQASSTASWTSSFGLLSYSISCRLSVISSAALAFTIMTFCCQAAIRALVKFWIVSVHDHPFCYMLLTADRASPEGKQLAITNHLLACDHRTAYHALEVMFAVSVSGVNQLNRLTVACSEVLNVCHESRLAG